MEVTYCANQPPSTRASHAYCISRNCAASQTGIPHQIMKRVFEASLSIEIR